MKKDVFERYYLPSVSLRIERWKYERYELFLNKYTIFSSIEACGRRMARGEAAEEGMFVTTASY